MQTPLYKGAHKFQTHASSLGRDTIDQTPSKSNLSTPQTSKEEDDAEDGAGEVIDFEKLKKLRQMLIKQRVVKYIELMKQNAIKEEDDVGDIINLTHKEEGQK